ncbi:helix-turn-helix transcriptional regulator [Pseudenhygromyxa sp. WMMC2535]|nr:helix-turn-helix transcriptional regulator [Pseudenhygromyxa sp. WMMC2535]
MFVNGLRVERISLDDGDVISLGPDAALRLVHQCEGKLTTPPLAPARAPAPPARASASASANMAAAQALDEDDTDEPTESVPLGSEVSTGTFKRKQPAKDALPLSARQLEVSRLVAEGLTNAAIAERLGISPRTVTSHLDHIYGRLGIGSRAALTRMIVERGLTE